MAVDYSSYDAGTAYLTVEPKLSDTFEADLATMVAAVPPLPVALTTDLDRFAQDLEREWNDKGYKLPVVLDPQLSDDAVSGLADRLREAGPFQLPLTADLSQFANDLDQRWREIASEHALPVRVTADFDGKALADELPGYTRITADLNLERAKEQLSAFFSLIPIYRIPVEFDFDAADAQMAEYRASRVLDETPSRSSGNRRGSGSSRVNYTDQQDRVRTGNQAREAQQYAAERDAALTRVAKQMEQEDREPVGAQYRAGQQQIADEKAAAEAASAAQQKARDDTDKGAKGLRDFTNAAKESDGLSFENLISGLEKVGSRIDDLGAKALKWGGIGGLVGGAAATLGAGALAGVLGAHGVLGAFEAERAVTQENEDPQAQMERQDKIRQAADQQREAQEGLSESLWKVSDSQTAAKLSSMALADAYKDVGREVRDATDALTDAQLAEEGAALGVAGARQHLMQDLMSGTANPLTIETDVYGVQAANQKYSESQKKTQDQKVDTAETLQRGVSGSPQIIQAEQSNIDAQHGVTLALQGVRDAEIRVSEAAIAMHEALMPTQAEDKLQIALGKLSPNARDFVETMHTQFVPAMHELSQTVSQNMFAGLGESLMTAVNDQMPAMKQGFGQIGTELNGFFKDLFSQLDSMFSSLEADGTMQKFVTGVGDALQGLAPLITGLTTGLIELGAEMGPHLGPLFAELGDFLSQLGQPLGEIGGAIADALTKLGPSLSPLLNALGDGLSQMIEDLAPVLPKVADALTDIFTAVQPLIDPLSQLASSILGVMADNASSLADALAPVIEQFASGLQPVIPIIADTLTQLQPTFTEMAQTLSGVLLDALQELLPQLPDLVQGFSDVAIQVAPILPDLVQLAADFADLMIQVSPVLPDLMDLASTILPPLADSLSGSLVFLDETVDDFSLLVGWIEKLNDGLNNLANSGGLLGQVLNISAGVLGHAPLTHTPKEAPQPAGSDDGFAAGGYFRGAGGPRDDANIIAVSDGEFIVNAASTAKHRGTLESINAGHYASGGYVDSSDQNSSGGGKSEAGKEVERQSRRRILGFQDGGYYDQDDFGGGGGDGTFGGGDSDDTTTTVDGGGDTTFGSDDFGGNVDSDPPDPTIHAIPGTDRGGAGGDASFGAPSAPATQLPSQTVSPVTPYTPNLGQYTMPSTGQGFQSAWQSDGATGGPVNAVAWARSHASTPYVWGGTSADGADCSGWVGDLQQVATGVSDPTGRLGTTMDVLGGTWPSFIPGASRDDLFVIGASDEHMVASVLGVNVEERQSGETARIGDNAASPWDPQFTVQGHIDPNVFVPAYTDPVQQQKQNPGSTQGNGNGDGNGDYSGLANQPVVSTMQVPTTWSGAANEWITRGMSQLWWGDAGVQAAQAANSKPGTTPTLDGGLHGTLQGIFQGWINSAPQDQQSSLSTFLLGPDLTGAKDKSATSGLTGLGSNGGLLGIIGIGLLGDGSNIKGLDSLLGEGLSFELQPVEKAVGWNDNFTGKAKAAWQGANDLQADQAVATMQTPKSGDPSTAKTPNAKDAGNIAEKVPSTGPGTTLPTVDTYAASFGASPALVSVIRQAATGYGWQTGAEWNALEQIIGHESSFRTDAQAPGSTAFGLGQFLDQTWATVGATKTTDAGSQARAMDAYIKQRYGDPITAWNFWEGQSPHWYSSGGDVSGDGSSISDSIPAWLSDGEFVVNARSADQYRPLLKLINADQAGTRKMAQPSTVPTRELLSTANVAHVDHSSTFHVQANDIDGSVKALKLLEAQRVAKANGYLGRWRNYRGI
ncbi:hypothetical protein ACIP5Y_21490 [Nocardia sp. NPDC088792]|uniref:aggregation-promoting factor C-terminal-like domain-containing protein n=1 Tax=Nocardia sp. NPDC088792 TaxID=3364332 RepID=UPI00382B77EB